MTDISVYGDFETSWCPGCGNHDILESLKKALATLGLAPHQVAHVSGIGQAAKAPHFMYANGFNGLQALFVVNLPEKKMAGEVSQGMLFDIGYADKLTPCLAIPETPLPNGSRAG
jgi:tRNA-binding EMAP/Myf-like protein